MSAALLEAPAVRPAAWRVLVAAARPATLGASVAPVVAGTALAHQAGGARWDLAACALLGALLIQVATNLHNDAADGARGTDDPAARLGPPRAVAMGWLSRRAALALAGAAAALALVPGAALVLAGGAPILALGLLSLLAGWAYTGGPRPLAYVGLGELFVVLFFGLGAVGGTVWVQRGAVGPEAAAAGLAVGLLAAAILAVNNLRDRAGDARAGKRTLAVRLGERFARAEHAACLLAPFALAGLVAAVRRDPAWAAPLLALPLALREVRLARRADGRDLNPRLGGAGRVQLAWALLLAGGAGVARA